MKYLLITIIRIYKRIISPLLGPHCRFYPSCSEYAISALERKGFFKAIFLIFYRLLRCNPLFKGGFDPLK
ncbi:MAG: membrane protein insertion efficiency factor YidD [Proteobacteria bacterium]|nr:membrane protein insertion efficiency factor YidD [Pseudomonadota bacterium]